MHLLGLRLTPSRLMLLPQKRHILATHHARALATNVRHDLGDQLRHRAILPTSMAFGPQPRVKGAQPKFGARRVAVVELAVVVAWMVACMSLR